MRIATGIAILKQVDGLLRHAALEGMSVRRDASRQAADYEYHIYGASGSREFIAEEIARRIMVPDNPSRQLVER